MAAAMKHMVAKLDKFEGVDFRRWQQKMHFLQSIMSVVYVLNTPIPDDRDDATSKSGEGANQEKNKWENDDYVCRGIILNVGSHLRIEEFLKVQDSDKPKGNNVAGPFVVNMVEHNNSIKYNDNKAFLSTSKLNDSILWHARLGHAHYKRMQDISKDGLILDFDIDTKNDLCDLHATPSLGNKKYFVTFIDDDSRFCYVYLLLTKDEALDKFKVFKTEVELQQGFLIKRFRTDREGEYMDIMAVVRLPDPKLKTLGERGIECIFVGYAEHSKAFRLYVIEPSESVSINSVTELRDAIFEENRFSSVPRPRTRDEVYDEHSYCFDVEDDPKTFDEAMKSQDVTFCKEAINDEMDSIMGNNTWVLADLPPGCKPLEAHVLQSSQGCAWNLLKRKMKSLLLNGLFL
ncbi:zinc finger, CCHC-type containing protein [Tanacetum coccineum]